MNLVFEKRLENTRKILDEKGLDCIILNTMNEGEFTTKPNIYYLTNFLGVWPGSVLVSKADAILFTSEMDKAPKQSAWKDIRPSGEMKKFVEVLKDKKIGIDGNASYRSHSKLSALPVQLVDISEDILKMRSVKDSKEIEKITAACKHTKKFFDAIENNLGSKSENKIDRIIKETALRNGVSLAFPNIVAGDSNSSEVHYMDNNSKFSKILMCDIGARFDNYNSDFTRTFVLKNDKEMKKAKQTLVGLQATLADMCIPGAKVKDISQKGVQILENAGYKKQHFGNFHALGHGVGLEVHEYPAVGSGSDVLQENQVITIEPGIYFENKFGVRIEDTYLVTKKGAKPLAKIKN